MTDRQLYEATRGVWRLGSDRDKAEFALSIAGGIVREVYSIGAWYPAGTTRYETRPFAEVAVPGRWEFAGEVAPDAVRQRYLGQSLAHYFAKGSASPVIYANIK